jgi:hypothetical protein
MPITVTKISEAFYIATAAPPHIQEAWSTPEPLRVHQLCQELSKRGGHQVDIGDAIDQADRDWIEKSREPFIPPWVKSQN